MLYNLTDVFTTEDKVVYQTMELEQTVFSHMGEAFAIAEKQPVELVFRNNGQGKAIIEGSVKAVVLMNCDRCLKEVKQTLEFSFSREVFSPETEKSNEEECDFMEGFNVDADELICSEILINWPMKVLCREDCKGICNVCGKDLNDGECGCDTFVPDPRMAVIKDIFNANKEV